MSGIWLGPITPDNIDYAIQSHFGERRETAGIAGHSSPMDLHHNAEIVGKTIVEYYTNWDNNSIGAQLSELRKTVAQQYDTEAISTQFNGILHSIINR